MSDLPPCPFRGDQARPGHYLCDCPDLVVPGGVVADETCRYECPLGPRMTRPRAVELPAGFTAARLKKSSAQAASRSGLPLVSCLMPTRDRPQFAAAAIRCFQAQDYPHRELIIVDDGTPGLADLAASDPRIRYLRSPADRPPRIGGKRNFATEQAQGEILMLWDDDDWYGAARLRRQAEPLLRGEADLTGLTTMLVYDLPQDRLWQTSPQAADQCLLQGVLCGNVAYHRRVPEELTCYPDVSLGEDVAFVRVALHRGARLIRLPGKDDYVYVRHGRNTWGNAAWYRSRGSFPVASVPWDDAQQRLYDELRAGPSFFPGQELATGLDSAAAAL